MADSHGATPSRCSWTADREHVLVLPHTVAVAPDVDDVTVVEQSVDERRRHDFVAEHAPAFLEALFEVSTVDARSCRALINWKN